MQSATLRVIQPRSPQEVKNILRDIKVDPYGVDIMYPKALHYLVLIKSVTNIAANILKQEMLSFGADAAIARGALTGSVKKTDCLLMGDLTHYSRLEQKLSRQPFGLSVLAKQLSAALGNFRREDFSFSAGRFRFLLGHRARIMGIINMTPDSFSADGFLNRASLKTQDTSRVLNYAQQLVREGADIIDVGGESSRPGARAVALKEEIARTIPVVKLLAKKLNVPVSIDTCKPRVAQEALDNGASIVNDISGLRDSKMIKIVSRSKAAVIIMHMKGNPRTMQKKPVYVSLMDDIIEYLKSRIREAEESGIRKDRIAIDPGIGFGKTVIHNLTIINKLAELKVLNKPILVGPSRKSFIGSILNAEPTERIFGTVSASVNAAVNGANIIRVHDVKAVSQALRISESICSQQISS